MRGWRVHIFSFSSAGISVVLSRSCRELGDALNAWDSATSHRLKQTHPLRRSEQGLPFPSVPVQPRTLWGPELGVANFVPQFPLLYRKDNWFFGQF